MIDMESATRNLAEKYFTCGRSYMIREINRIVREENLPYSSRTQLRSSVWNAVAPGCGYHAAQHRTAVIRGRAIAKRQLYE
ncbi:Uncharacterised protein [uncultured archaeon]|nr:Uncharacterised protein [uncultured archaeon]